MIQPKPKRAYAICSNCIMDTTDSNITFDPRGWCDYCTNFHQNILPDWHPDEQSEREILAIADTIKRAGKVRDHNALLASAAAWTALTLLILQGRHWGCDR